MLFFVGWWLHPYTWTVCGKKECEWSDWLTKLWPTL